MRIESGTTGERFTRIAIFLGMCLIFTGWFTYDGFVGYPSKNLNWARQALPGQPDDLETNPKVVMNKESLLKQGISVEEASAILGQSALDEKKELIFSGTDVIVRVGIEGGKIADLVREEVTPNNKPEKPNLRVRPEKIEQITIGMVETDLIGKEGNIGIFGQPTEIHPRTLWFVGPAAYARVEVHDGKVSDWEFRESHERTEGDILAQKCFAVLLAVLSLVVMIKLFRVIIMRVVLDDTGLKVNGKHIAWNEMSGLNSDEYDEKGWVDLSYIIADSTQSLRLDSYHIKHFDDIINAICDNKGFESPISKRANGRNPNGSD